MRQNIKDSKNRVNVALRYSIFSNHKKSPGLKVASNHYICRGLNSIKVDRDINEQPSLSLLLKLPNDSS